MPQAVKHVLSGLGALPPMYEGTVPKYEITNLPDQYDVYSNMVGADKYPVTALYNEWCDVTSMYEAILTGDPYPIRAGINEAGSFMNEGNANLAWDALQSLDMWVDLNMFHHPSTEMADIVLPVAHWLEINNIRVSQGASGGIGMTCRAVEPPADVKFDYDVNRLIFESFEKQGNPNGTWTNIKGDAPGAYDSDERMEDWFRAHNEVDGFGDRYPGCKWQHMQEYVDDFQEHGWFNARCLSRTAGARTAASKRAGCAWAKTPAPLPPGRRTKTARPRTRTSAAPRLRAWWKSGPSCSRRTAWIRPTSSSPASSTS